ncbi:uncharacterized protein TRAVEDRAFT_47186 [Trametes versicolor FP-101664 SS1]|uniref:uncharacterized protein n=1 Tax=Trametes versicolor (strain FP-101664) TaxID=717944 RepID=UPI0004622073|nr:uncharacterized protein TRAVEDRAFT_47186 [Trametes versicolor FP-101664 SS1]EIW59884.1 hypothetical protein TRAVEDRAFT_47186 [Trametes versicolor FP-101664 SS1]
MDRGTISTLKRTTPVPAPRALPGGVHRTIRPGFATLQEQMRLEHDRETFLKIVRMIRRTAARHIDLTKSWVWQDPQTLEDIKEEILAQCPLLGEVYVDAWPITSYLRRSLKEHKSGGNKSKGGYGSRCGPATPTTKPVLNKCAYVAIPSRQGTQKTQYMTEKAKVSFSTSTTSNNRAIARSYSPSEKAVEDILELSDSECESKECPASSQPSNSSGNAHSKTRMSSAETASIISATEGSPGIDEYQNEKSDYDVEFIRR